MVKFWLTRKNKQKVTFKFQKLTIVGLLIIGQAFAAPDRLQRDAPLLPAWDIPGAGFASQTGFFDSSFLISTFNDEAGVVHEEHGPPEEPPQVPHEEYGPPELALAPTTEQ